jgi:hypothetical protein
LAIKYLELRAVLQSQHTATDANYATTTFIRCGAKYWLFIQARSCISTVKIKFASNGPIRQASDVQMEILIEGDSADGGVHVEYSSDFTQWTELQVPVITSLPATVLINIDPVKQIRFYRVRFGL